MKQSILAFCGAIGSGKSTISLELAALLKYKYASFGNYVRNYANQMGYNEPTREQLQAFGEMLVTARKEEFCLSVLEDAKWSKGEGLIVDGIRHLSILNTLENICFPQKLFLIYVTIDKSIRTIRLIQRGRDKEALLSDHHSTELQVHELLKTKANLIIDGGNSIIENINQIINWLDQ